MVAPLDVGIVGAGTAGLASALFLSRAGHRVTLYERVAEPGAVGAGIILQPTGQHVLGRLGLLAEVAARGAPIDRLLCETLGRRPIVDLNYAAVGRDRRGLGMHRGVIFEHLYDAVRREPVTVRLGADVGGLSKRAQGWSVDAAGGGTLGHHELVVVADGARSHLRERGLLAHRASRYRWGALWFVARDLDARYRGALWQIVERNHTMFGLLPTGLGPGTEADGSLVSLYWSIREDRVDALREAGLDAWKARARALAPGCEPVLAQISSLEQLVFTAYYDVRMAREHADGLVFLGDAAHAMSPQLGQGCNLALWDAMVLADAIAREGDLGRALATYGAERRGHLAFYQFVTRWLTPFFQSDATILGVARDLFFPWLARIPWFRRLMTESMVGVRRGILGGRVELPLAEQGADGSVRLRA